MAKRKWTDEDLIEAVKKSKYWSEVGDALGLQTKHLKPESVIKAIDRLNIDTTHLSYKDKFQTEELKKKLSEIRKEWIKNNPDKHSWSKYNRSESKPEQIFKEALLKSGISATQYYIPPENERCYELDFAIPSLKIAFEINGNQHYKDGKLAPYYQERHDYFNSLGWTMHEIHYYECLKLERAIDVIRKCIYNEKIEYTTSPEVISYKEVLNKQKMIDKENKAIQKLQIIDLESKIKLENILHNIIDDKDKIVNEILKIRVPWNKGKENHSNRKVDRPSKEVLQKMLWEKPTTQIAKELGVSDKAIEKWVKKYGCTKPPRGYWAKLSSNDFIDQKKCFVCGSIYDSKHINSKYCSDKCRNKAHWSRNKLIK